MPTPYPLPVYHFSVDWGGARVAFAEVKGLDIFIEPITYRDGASKVDAPQQMPGLEKYNTVTLIRALVKGDDDFYEWIKTKKGSTIERRDVVIKLLDENHDPTVTWRLQNAFPIRYSGPRLLAMNNEPACEELELVHEGLSVDFTP